MEKQFELDELSFLSEDSKEYLHTKENWIQIINSAIRRHKFNFEYKKSYRKSEVYKKNREDENECLKKYKPEMADFKNTIFYNEKFTIFGTKRGFSKKDIAIHIQGALGGIYRTEYSSEISIIVLADKPGKKALEAVKDSKRSVTLLDYNDVEKIITEASLKDY